MPPGDKKYLILLMLCLCFGSILSAQTPDYLLKENSVWVMGINYPAYGSLGIGATLTFNTDPIPSAKAINTAGAGVAVASVCDTAGRLLFYTNGTYVFDATGSIMPHGDSLVADTNLYGVENLYSVHHDTSNHQDISSWVSDPTSGNLSGALILPVIGVSGQYYVFSLTSEDHWGYYMNSPFGHEAPGNNGELFYSIVDMNLNNGLGDVISGTKGKLLNTKLNECMTAVAGTHCDLWLLTQPYSVASTFIAYHITALGIDTAAIISHVSGDLLWGSSIKVSPDRTKLAVGGYESAVYNFNPSSGVVSNQRRVKFSGLSSSQAAGSLCFSPDNSKLYLNVSGYINQVDLRDSLLAAQFTGLYLPNGTDIQLAPDGKLYMTQYDTATHLYTGNHTSIACIQEPDSLSYLCRPVTDYIKLPAGSLVGAGLHNMFVKPIEVTKYRSHLNLSFCYPAIAALQLTGPAEYDHYLWNTGDTVSTISARSSELYVLKSISACASQIDSFQVKKINDEFSLGPDSFYCANNIVLHPSSASSSYIWQNGSTADSFIVSNSGTYSAQIIDQGCVYTDTVNIKLYNVKQNLGNDTTLCTNDHIIDLTLEANATPGAKIRWSTGETAAKQIVGPGTWWVTVTDGPCTGTDTISITGELCQCKPYIPNAFSPNGDGRNDEFRALFETGCPVSYYTLRVFNRWGAIVFSSVEPQKGWDGTYQHIPADVGNYMYEVQFLLGTNPGVHRLQGDVTLIR